MPEYYIGVNLLFWLVSVLYLPGKTRILLFHRYTPARRVVSRRMVAFVVDDGCSFVTA